MAKMIKKPDYGTEKMLRWIASFFGSGEVSDMMDSLSGKPNEHFLAEAQRVATAWPINGATSFGMSPGVDDFFQSGGDMTDSAEAGFPGIMDLYSALGTVTRGSMDDIPQEVRIFLRFLYGAVTPRVESNFGSIPGVCNQGLSKWPPSSMDGRSIRVAA